MKIIISIIVLLVAVFVVWKFVMTKPPQDLPQAQVSDTSALQDSNSQTVGVSGINKEKSMVKITGYGPGKEHPVSFMWNDSLSITDGVLSGSIEFDLASVKTDNAGLDTHLCSDDFFNCAVNKTVTFTITEATTSSVTGTIVFAGQSRVVTFPVTAVGNTVSADFRLDRTPFNFKFTLANVAAVDKEVRVEFTMVGN